MAAYTLKSNIPYISPPHNHPRQVLDLYTPTSPPPTSAGYPLIIFIHGGAFKFGSKETPLLPHRLISTHTAALAALNYRLSGDAIFPAAVQDCRAAVRYLHAHSAEFTLDTSHFVAMGESAGAYMALMIGIPGPDLNPVLDFDDDAATTTLANHPCQVAGVISFYGPTSFLEMDEQAPAGSPHVHNAPDSPESLFLGSPITQVPDLVARASPLTYVGTHTPAVLACHGTADAVVPFGQSEVLGERLREKGREVVVHSVEGVDHVWQGISQRQQEELDGVVDQWLERVFERGGGGKNNV